MPADPGYTAQASSLAAGRGRPNRRLMRPPVQPTGAGAAPATGAAVPNAPAAPAVPAWKRLADAGIAGQGSAGANRAMANTLGGTMSGPMSSFTKPLVLPGFQLPSNIGDFDAGFQGRGVGGGAVGAERPGIESAIGNLRAQLGAGPMVSELPGIGAGMGGFEGPNAGMPSAPPNPAAASRFLSRIGRNAIPAINMTKPNFLGSGGNTAAPPTPVGGVGGGGNPYLDLLRRRLVSAGAGGGDLAGGRVQYSF